MRKRIIWSVAGIGLVGTCLGALALAKTDRTGRPDCPGTTVCPLSGGTVCRDRCPLEQAPREQADRNRCCVGTGTEPE
jgi:hypothetical protein